MNQESLRRLLAAFTTFLILVAGVCQHASAQDVASAARAFRQGQQADLAEQFARAAEFYELADSLAPSPEALRSALRARLRAGHRAAAAGLAELLIRRYDDQSSRDLADRTLSQLRPGLVRVLVSCDSECSVLVDGTSAVLENAREHRFFVSPGSHQLVARFEYGEAEPVQMTSRAGREESFSFESPPAPPDPPAGGIGGMGFPGLPTWHFITGASFTVAFTIAATIFGLRTNSLHDDWQLNQGDRELYDEGTNFQLGTNLLIGAAVTTAVATLVVALFTDWDGDETEESPEEELPVALEIGPNSIGATLRLSEF